MLTTDTKDGGYGGVSHTIREREKEERGWVARWKTKDGDSSADGPLLSSSPTRGP